MDKILQFMVRVNIPLSINDILVFSLHVFQHFFKPRFCSPACPGKHRPPSQIISTRHIGTHGHSSFANERWRTGEVTNLLCGGSCWRLPFLNPSTKVGFQKSTIWDGSHRDGSDSPNSHWSHLSHWFRTKSSASLGMKLNFHVSVEI